MSEHLKYDLCSSTSLTTTCIQPKPLSCVYWLGEGTGKRAGKEKKMEEGKEGGRKREGGRNKGGEREDKGNW